MGFLSPWFLLGALAAALPVYVHLLRQHRSDPVRFSSLMFMERRVQSSVKHRRLKYLALFLLRLLVILLLALMFANPFIRRTAASAGARKLMIVAVDNSFSMQTGERFEQARREAAKLIDGMRAGDRAQLATFGNHVQFLTQQVDDKEQLRRAVSAMQVGDGRSAYGEVARMLRTVGRPDGMPVEAHIISDMQRSSMPVPFAELALPPAMKLHLHPVASSREPNWFVENVLAPRSVFQPKSVRVQATVAGAGTPASEVPVELVMNGRVVESRRVKLGEGGRTLLDFQLPDAAYGLNRGEVRLSATDALQADNSFPFALERREAARILLVHGPRAASSATYYGAALGAVPEAGYSVETLAADQAANVAPDRYAAVVLADPGQLPSTLE
ncbi:MAG TPA: BatA domain-containing protein, partial [Bryobacteraceae bacterium]|nr:BatA domain-containing protein [Bryobacteraceae bacterium]